MAERRMFAKTIIDSDAFLDMPATSQLLYFHLSMRADDDGFINKPKTIMRICGCKDDDMGVLIAKRFILPFETGVVVVKHWRIHNYIRKDTYSETKYKDEKATLAFDENNAYTPIAQSSPLLPETSCVDESSTLRGRDVDEALTQVRLGKDRLGQVRSGKGSLGENEGESAPPAPAEPPAKPPVPYEEICGLYNQICVSYPRCTSLSDGRKKAIRARFSSGHSLDDFKILFEKAEASSFLKGKNARNWTATFDWLIKDSSMAKVLDGNYDETGKTGTDGSFSTSNPFLELLEERRSGT